MQLEQVVVRALTLMLSRAGSWHISKILRFNTCKLLIGVCNVPSGRHCACARGDEAHEMSQLICLRDWTCKRCTSFKSLHMTMYTCTFNHEASGLLRHVDAGVHPLHGATVCTIQHLRDWGCTMASNILQCNTFTQYCTPCSPLPDIAIAEYPQ